LLPDENTQQKYPLLNRLALALITTITEQNLSAGGVSSHEEWLNQGRDETQAWYKQMNCGIK